MTRFFTVLAIFGAQLLASAQFLPDLDAKARNLTVVKSPADDSVTVSYKEPTGACKTAFDSQKQYTGWVSIPGATPTNLFFWFVESRQKSDSLTVWLNGGPGASSLYGFFAGSGPCRVFDKAVNQYETAANEWGWDRASNMLFIDQPSQTGFAYDTPTNATALFSNGTISSTPTVAVDGAPAWDLVNGTFSSGDFAATANTTQIAALATWHLMQGFFSTFPQFQDASNTSIAVNLFAESYGGVYGPVFSETFEEQNSKRAKGQLSKNTTVDVNLVSLGIINGCVDTAIQTRADPDFAVNNTYGIQALPKLVADRLVQQYNSPTGCKALLAQCEANATQLDPDGLGTNIEVNGICREALTMCLAIESPFYQQGGLSAYDVAAPSADPNPSYRFIDYLNQADVLTAIGSPINYTFESDAVNEAFYYTGDRARGGGVQRIAKLLQSGVRVGFIYGDRDYICNWFGGEQVSVAVAKAAGGNYADKFPSAGYANIAVNDSYVGGLVRQVGNLSFSRIFQAGHSVAWYQPETAFQVFTRIALGRSVATGTTIDASSYNTTGISDARSEKGKAPPVAKPTCYVRNWATCNDDAISLLKDDSGVVINGVLYADSSDFSASTPTATQGGASATGMYTATGAAKGSATPSSSNAAAASLPTHALVAGAVIGQALVLW